MNVASRLGRGRVSHRRMAPRPHQFDYLTQMVYLDLDESTSAVMDPVVRQVSRRLLRRDHFGDPKVPLSTAVRDLVETETGSRPLGPVRLLTHVRQLGYVMNPVSFFYCWTEDGSFLDAIVAEVHNTPWGETHTYCLKCDGADRSKFEFQKEFHVSPFMSMGQTYVWTFTKPGDSLSVTMTNLEDGVPVFVARLDLDLLPMRRRTWAVMTWGKPFFTFSVITRIYVQAAKLWLKRCPYFPHPNKEARQ